MIEEIPEKYKYNEMAFKKCMITDGFCMDGDCRQCNVPIIKAIRDLKPPVNLMTVPMSIDMERELEERFCPTKWGVSSTSDGDGSK